MIEKVKNFLGWNKISVSFITFQKCSFLVFQKPPNKDIRLLALADRF